MKFSLLFVLPLLFISCGDKNLDRSLDGVWYGQVQTSDLGILERVSTNADRKAVTETLILKIDRENMTIYRSLDKDTLLNRTQVEIGTYSKSGKLLTFKINRHSCAGDPMHPTQRVIAYERAENFEEVTLTFFKNKTLTLKRPDFTEQDIMEKQLATSETGCFSDNGGFTKGQIESPDLLVDLEEIRNIEAEVQTELSDVHPELKVD